MKKRWFWLCGAITMAIGVGVWAKRPAPPTTVRTMALTPTRVEQTVSCNGVVEAADGIGVFLPVDCVIREVYVAVGQRVKKGDTLAVVDKEATHANADDVAAQIALAGMPEEVTAPEDGIVVEVSATAGKVVVRGTPCVLLVRPCDLQVRIAIREKDLRVLREGMCVRIGGDGLAQSTYGGTLTEISSTASSSGSSTIVEGVVTPDEGIVDASFRLGISTKATVVTSVIEEGYLIPYEAVLSDEKGSYLYLLSGGVARRHNVEGAIPVAQGLLLNNTASVGATIILEPEKVSGDGATVTEVAS